MDRRARVAAGVVLLGTAGSLLTLGLDWTEAAEQPVGPPGERLLTWGGSTYLLPLVVMAVGAVLLWVRGVGPVALGMVAGAGVMGLVVMAQQLLRFEGHFEASAGFWAAVVLRAVAVGGVLLVGRRALGADDPGGRASLLLRVLGVLVVVTATVGGYVLALLIPVAPSAQARLTVFATVALVVGLAAVLLPVGAARQRALLAAVTALCVLMALSDLQLWAGSMQFTQRNSRWQLIEAAIAAAVLLAAWAVRADVRAAARRRDTAPRWG